MTVSVGLGLVPLAATPAPAASGLAGIDLGTLGGRLSVATAINESGRVVGWSYNASGVSRAFSWTATTGMVDIGTLGGATASAGDVNDAGVVAGGAATATSAGHAFVWDATNGMTDLGTLGGATSGAVAINNAGVVAGTSLTASGATHAFVWDATNGMTDLGAFAGDHTTATAINEAGQVVGDGWFTNALDTHAFRWDATNGLVDVGTLGGATSRASGINASGVVTGITDVDPGPSSVNHGFSWAFVGGLTDAGVMFGVGGINNAGTIAGGGPLTGAPSSNDAVVWNAAEGVTSLGVNGLSHTQNNTAVGINDASQVIGGQFGGYVADGYGDINFLPGPLATDFTAPTDINDRGHVVGYWYNDPDIFCCGSGHAMLWTTNPGRSISVAGASVVEGDGGTRTVSATVTLSSASPSPITVKYAIVQNGYGKAGTQATPDGDFKERFPGGTLTFKPVVATGLTRTSAVINAVVIGDTTTEADEHFEIQLSNPTGPVVLGSSQVPVTVINDDPGSGAQASVGDARIWEGDSGIKNTVRVAVNLRSPATVPMTVKVTLGGGTATGPGDWTGAVTRTVSFPVGAYSRMVAIGVVPDLNVEGDETVPVALSNPTGGLTIGRANGTITIQNDDA